MSPDRPDAAPVEIGDLDDDLAPEAVAPPHVVIQYRERGIPWLLVPPLIALSAVIAVVAAYSVRKYVRAQPSAPKVVVAPSSQVAPATEWVDQPPPPTGPSDSLGLPIVESAPGLPPLILAESPAEIPLGDAAAPPEPTESVAVPIADASLTPAPGPPPSEAVASIGFDPASLLPGVSGDAPLGGPVDPALASTHLGGDPFTGASAIAPGPEVVEAARPEPPQAPGIPVALLPRDPESALRERRRFEAEQRQFREAERFQFQAELRAVCKDQGNRAAPAVQSLVKAYNSTIPPGAMEQATKLLGKSGIYARVDLPQRLRLLRGLGFPEPILIKVIYDYETGHIGASAREAPSPEVMYLRAAQILLNNPPTRPSAGASATTRATPATTVPSGGPVR